MIIPEKTIKVPRKLQKMATIGRKRSTFSRSNEGVDLDNENLPLVTCKGHFVIYTVDRKRFAIPLAYLGNGIFQELFRMSEEEFGVSSNGPIVLPCDSVLMHYILSLIQQGLPKEFEQVLIDSTIRRSCSASASADSSVQEPKGHIFVATK